MWFWAGPAGQDHLGAAIKETSGTNSLWSCFLEQLLEQLWSDEPETRMRNQNNDLD